jgi:hypothetical protein
MEQLVILVPEIELILQTVTVQPDGTITEPMMLLVTNVKKSVKLAQDQLTTVLNAQKTELEHQIVNAHQDISI